MNRLTPEHGWNNACYDTWEVCGMDHTCKRSCREPEPCLIPKMLYRLAAYEDTGLEPEEVAELAQAKADGRLVVLPCKVGDVVYVLTADSLNGIEETSINRIIIKKNSIVLNANCKHDDWGRAAWNFRPSAFGKTVFLTRAEAEAAHVKEET